MICKSGDMLKVVVMDHDSTRACLGDYFAGLSWCTGPKQTISFHTWLVCHAWDSKAKQMGDSRLPKGQVLGSTDPNLKAPGASKC